LGRLRLTDLEPGDRFGGGAGAFGEHTPQLVKVFPVTSNWTTLVLSDRFMTLREPQAVRSVRKVSDSRPVMILKALISFDTVAAGLVAPTTKVANGRAC
jgi:hypothetical protein